MAKILLDFGYTQREELRFPAKKLKALWFSPPSVPVSDGGSGVNGPLPRVFISELLVDQISPQAQVCCSLLRAESILKSKILFLFDKSNYAYMRFLVDT